VLVRRLDTVLEHRRAQLRERRDVLMAEIAARLPDWSVLRPEGGLSLWCRLPHDVGSATVAAAAASRGLLLAEGDAFGTGHAFDDRLRLPFTLPPGELRAAAATIEQVVAQLRSAPARDRMATRSVAVV
jgi:DNA-binding transcriptional MocR family regulator